MLKLDLPILESERLILRPFRIEDASDMFEYASDPEVLKYLWWEVHPNIETTLNSIETRFMTANERGLPTAYAIEVKKDHKMIGSIDVHTVMFNDVGVIGYVINKHYWGQGIVTEALQMLIPTLFHYSGFYRLEINHCADNIGSGKVIKKAGFIEEGRFRKRRTERDGHRGDYIFYGLCSDDDIVKERYTKGSYEKYLRK